MTRIELGGRIVLPNSEGLEATVAAGGNRKTLMKLDANDELVVTHPMRQQSFDFTKMPEPLALKKVGAGAATGTAGDENMLMWPGLTLEYHVLGTQTILAPTMTATGFDINSQDQTDNDGIELCPGILASSPFKFTVGTDAAFKVRAKISVADVSGTDDLAIGFRKAEAYQANLDDYDEMACLNVISGDINTETILNGAATTSTDTTDNLADAGTVTLEVKVSAAGVVSYLIDGAPPTAVAATAFTFDDAEVVVPFIYCLNASDVAGEVVLIEWECGLDS